jgi:hypothetical protein
MPYAQYAFKAKVLPDLKQTGPNKKKINVIVVIGIRCNATHQHFNLRFEMLLAAVEACNT